MGRDKAILPFGGQSLIERVVDTLVPLVDDIVVVGSERHISLPGSATFVPDDIPGAGPLGGLLTGLKTISHETALTVACDMPFLDRRVLHLLLALSDGYDAVVPEVGGRLHPLHAVYNRRIIPKAERCIAHGRLKLAGLLSHLTVRWIREDEINPLDPAHHSFINVNTLEEWHEAAAIR
jgi:molybdopterin-guanine dinucleotide biosynthesis protein A